MISAEEIEIIDPREVLMKDEIAYIKVRLFKKDMGRLAVGTTAYMCQALTEDQRDKVLALWTITNKGLKLMKINDELNPEENHEE